MKQAAKDEQKKIPPSQLFCNETDKFSKFDDKVFEYNFCLLFKQNSWYNLYSKLFVSFVVVNSKSSDKLFLSKVYKVYYVECNSYNLFLYT